MIFKDLKNPSRDEIKQTTKQKRIFQGPNSEFVMVKCGTCEKLSVCFSHSQHLIKCTECSSVLLTPAGGRANFTRNLSIKNAEKYFSARDD